MSEELLRNRVEKVICTLLGKKNINHDLDLNEAGLDSLSKLELLALLEKSFDVEITDDLIEEFKTIGHVARVVGDAVSQKAAGFGRVRS